MTYAQLQFVKAEAAYRSGDKATALDRVHGTAISAHIDFVNARNSTINQAATQITAAEKAAFLADPRIVPTTAAALTLTQIMTQKYIAQWAWGHNELWMDMRRYHYTDIDPATRHRRCIPGFTPPPTNPVSGQQRQDRAAHPAALQLGVRVEHCGAEAIGGDPLDYHTKPIWITQP